MEKKLGLYLHCKEQQAPMTAFFFPFLFFWFCLIAAWSASDLAEKSAVSLCVRKRQAGYSLQTDNRTCWTNSHESTGSMLLQSPKLVGKANIKWVSLQEAGRTIEAKKCPRINDCLGGDWHFCQIIPWKYRYNWGVALSVLTSTLLLSCMPQEPLACVVILLGLF